MRMIVRLSKTLLLISKGRSRALKKPENTKTRRLVKRASFEVLLSIRCETIICLCVRDYMGIRGSWWLKRLPRHRNDLSIWRWSLVGPDICIFGRQTANTKFSGPDLLVKWAVLILEIFLGNWWISPSADASVVLGEKVWRDFLFCGLRQK